ncbi:MAG: DUF4350 domain-containing protein [Gammaproteobacteria bacterium]
MSSRARMRHAGRVIAVIAVAFTLVHLADRSNHVIDVSREARNSLTAPSLAILTLMEAPIEAVALVPPTLPVARSVSEFFSRYQRHAQDFSLEFLDPAEDPARARTLGATLGEVVLRYEGRSERLERLTESSVTNALARLARGAGRHIVFLAANGERQVDRDANHDVSLFARHLDERGLTVHPFRLGAQAAIPDNTAVLVIASPEVPYSVGELAQINAWVATGGNVLWLAEPDQPTGLAGLARALGVTRLPGTVVDPVGLTRLDNAAYAVVAEYPAHAALDGFRATVALPWACAFLPAADVGWTATPLATTGPGAWTETGAFSGNVGYDADDEVQGALIVALALTRPRADGGEQRVVVVGDGDFLSNTFVESLGNRELGRRLVEWLAADDALVDIEVPPVADALLDLAMWQRLAIFFCFGVLLPLAFLANAVLLAWRRRRA